MNISDNPFFMLGVSTRDNRRQITAAAEEKAFVSGSDDLGEARTALLIPEKRIAAEVRWFPGMDDAKVSEISEFFRNMAAGKSIGLMSTDGFRSLAWLNFSVYMFGYKKFAGVSDMAGAVLAVCSCFDGISTEGVCATVNNDRLIAGFPMTDEAELDRALNDYRADILAVIEGRLSGLSREEYTGLAEELAGKYADESGKYYGSILLGDFLAGYELNILPRLDEHMRTIRGAVSRIRDFLPGTVLAELSRCLKEWRRLSGPLLKAEGVTGIENGNIRGQAGEIFGFVRERAVALHNEHGRTSDALRLIQAVKGYIDGISAEISRTLSSDVRELEGLERRKRKADEEYSAWARSLYYEAEFGLIFRDKLIISADGISWKGVNTPLDEVEGISWGGIVGSYMTEYNVIIHTPRSAVRLTPNKKKYEEITEHLWKALAGFISTRILKQLQSGKTLSFGSIKVKDEGCYLSGLEHFPSNTQGIGIHGENTSDTYGERYYQICYIPDSRNPFDLSSRRTPIEYRRSHINEKFFKWWDTCERSQNGRLFIVSNKYSALASSMKGLDDRMFALLLQEPGEYSASASYISDMNTHILEAILRQFRSSGFTRLSSLLSSS